LEKLIVTHAIKESKKNILFTHGWQMRLCKMIAKNAMAIITQLRQREREAKFPGYILLINAELAIKMWLTIS
jgi:hypothetical protein